MEKHVSEGFQYDWYRASWNYARMSSPQYCGSALHSKMLSLASKHCPNDCCLVYQFRQLHKTFRNSSNILCDLQIYRLVTDLPLLTSLPSVFRLRRPPDRKYIHFLRHWTDQFRLILVETSSLPALLKSSSLITDLWSFVRTKTLKPITIDLANRNFTQRSSVISHRFWQHIFVTDLVLRNVWRLQNLSIGFTIHPPTCDLQPLSRHHHMIVDLLWVQTSTKHKICDSDISSTAWESHPEGSERQVICS